MFTGKTKTRAAVATLVSSLLLPGCESLDALFGKGEERAHLNVFVTHHATPEDGVIPAKGGNGDAREFTTDEGWNITLVEAHLVTTGIELHSCDGETVAVELFDGPLAEDLSSTDLDLQSLGGVEVAAGTYCSATVHYGPFHSEERSGGVVQAKTFVMAGLAEKGNDMVPFEIETDASIAVDLDLGQLDVSGDEPFPIELTLSKTYDRLFDGVDFRDLSGMALEEHVLALLSAETRICEGTVIHPK
jgi:hypothetical protein